MPHRQLVVSASIGPFVRAKCTELCQDAFSNGVCVPKQHPSISVTTDEGHFRDGEAALEKPADSFVSQIVKMKVRYARP
jgi:hypothetical protein